MTKLVQLVGDAAAVLGVLVCAGAGLARVARIWNFGGIQIPTLFQLGMALMIVGCLAKLHLLASAKSA